MESIRKTFQDNKALYLASNYQVEYARKAYSYPITNHGEFTESLFWKLGFNFFGAFDRQKINFGILMEELVSAGYANYGGFPIGEEWKNLASLFSEAKPSSSQEIFAYQNENNSNHQKFPDAYFFLKHGTGSLIQILIKIHHRNIERKHLKSEYRLTAIICQILFFIQKNYSEDIIEKTLEKMEGISKAEINLFQGIINLTCKTSSLLQIIVDAKLYERITKNGNNILDNEFQEIHRRCYHKGKQLHNELLEEISKHGGNEKMNAKFPDLQTWYYSIHSGSDWLKKMEKRIEESTTKAKMDMMEVD
ncbi:hypothetical protein PGT21_013418 [Puccinia graminis f. sp. tritici]|uniref:Uncharacterized protein n=1 Tax=Puccinia graminis f. sp. tritici TaxID=56615 RepID=A0A5B0Q2T6_PUCGR|nr:hypothetical protein PGT21_013418 [Puccinia graminis f. sp. tritici]KAA1124774.1 hypothetical protein PGTUg99_034262 [Puccinia graminis f. sp. tritici]